MAESKRTAAIAAEEQLDEDTQKDKFLTFHLGDEYYGIEIRYVTEIIGIQRITAIPEMPAYIKGVINLRGKIIPVMDVRLRFRLDAREYDERTCVIVVNIDETSVGLVVDTVSEVSDIPETNIESATGLNRGKDNAFISGIGKIGNDIKILLDVNRLLYDGEAAALQAATGAAA